MRDTLFGTRSIYRYIDMVSVLLLPCYVGLYVKAAYW